GGGSSSGGGGSSHSSSSSSSSSSSAFRDDEEEWLCPICEWLRKQLPQLDDEIALEAIRLAAGPRSLDEAKDCRLSYVGWQHEDLNRFKTWWTPPQLLALQYGDGYRR
ncbi:phd-finger domain-containing protein, partial [Cystoisospora suis]